MITIILTISIIAYIMISYPVIGDFLHYLKGTLFKETSKNDSINSTNNTNSTPIKVSGG